MTPPWSRVKIDALVWKINNQFNYQFIIFSLLVLHLERIDKKDTYQSSFLVQRVLNFKIELFENRWVVIPEEIGTEIS